MRSMQNRNAIRQSDAEITRPHNELTDDPSAPAWHVHLELRPEELVVLHRLGFTGGALAWREGMREWQPLRVGENGMAERESGGSEPPPPVAGSEAPRRPSIFSHGPHSTPPLAQPMAVPLVKLRAQAEMLPPPPPVEPRAFSVDHDEQSGAIPRFALSEPELSPALVGELPELKPYDLKPSSIPPGVALDTLPRPPTRSTGSKALWLGAAALVALSASNGALVSALLWSLRHDARPSAMAAKLTAAAKDAQDPSACPIPSGRPAKEEPASPAPAASSEVSALGTHPVSIEQLPLASATTASATETESAEANTSATSRRWRGRRASARRSSPAHEAAHQHIDSAVAPAELAANNPPDRQAMAQAVGRAAGAAASCAGGPQNGRVALTFAPSGNVQSVALVQGFGDAEINSCVLRAMGRAHVKAFSGEVITVQKTLSW